MRIAADQDAPESSRVSSAGTILEFAYRSAELESVLSRLDALEQQLAGLPATPALATNGRGHG